MKSTEKLYLTHPFATSCEATIEAIDESKSAIGLDRTVAFPEGGGQAADSGFIKVTDLIIPFFDVYKLPGRIIFIKDFPTITVDNFIFHKVPPEALPNLRIGMKIMVSIDIERRAKTAIYHSAAHLVFLAVGSVRPDAISSVKGCSIKENSARFDFAVKERFSEENLLNITHIANQYVEKDMPIEVFPHDQEKEAWYWRCNNETIPCGGTHIPRTGLIGHITVKRRRMAKDLERILIEVPSIRIPLNLYVTK